MGFFVDYSDLLGENPAQLNYGISVLDIDGDGQLELFVAGYGHPNRVYKWNGRVLVDIADEVLADEYRNAIGVAAADVNQDGREEIYVLNTDTFSGRKEFGDRLFAWIDGAWVDLFELPQNRISRNLTAGRSVVALDRMGRGKYGFYVANYGGPTLLYELDDQGVIQNKAHEAKLDRTTGGRGVISLPLLPNSKGMDVFAVNENDANFFFRNNGDGTFSEKALELNLDDFAHHGRGVAAFDENGDGFFDLVYGNWEGEHRLMLFNPKQNHFTNIASAEMAQPSRIRTVIVADFDNDGEDEIFFNNIGEPNRLFKKHGQDWKRIEIGAALEAFGFGTGAVAADIDGDGILELIISHGESNSQPMTLYKSWDAAARHYLRIMPLTQYGAPARGAIVRLYANGKRQTKHIDAGSGYLCQMEPVAHFGLGLHTDIEKVEVIWPDGKKGSFKIDEVDSLIKIAHPD